jgi:large subunit ribosomal protein L29
MAKEKSLNELTIDELKAMAKDLDREVFQLRNELSTQRKLEKPHQIKAKRKDKARVLTMLTQKQKGIA